MSEKSASRLETAFENLVGWALRIYGHPITFILAFILVIFFLIQSLVHHTESRDFIRDIILSISFLSFFIIQRAVNKTTTATQIKINELIASHDKARNELISIDEKTETELEKMKEIHKPGSTGEPGQDARIKSSLPQDPQ